MKNLFSVPALSLSLLALPVFAGEETVPTSSMAQVQAEWQALAGTFEQTIKSPEGEVIAQSAGDFALLKPKYIRWQTTAPSNQLVMTDGEYLWFYDVDLETVTKRDITDDIAMPMDLLGASLAELKTQYRVTELPDGFALEPKTSDALFINARVTFSEGLPVELAVKNQLKQDVVLAINSAIPESLEPESFTFVLPEYADFLDQTNPETTRGASDQ